MPIEIRELVIRARISDQPDTQADSQPPHGSVQPAGHTGLSAEQTELIVQACVRQVLRVLAQQQER